jgi:hypothetical protein
MSPVIDKTRELVKDIRNDIRQFGKHIASCEALHSLDGEAFTHHKSLLKEHHGSLRQKVHLLETILETDSTEILGIVEQKGQ